MTSEDIATDSQVCLVGREAMRNGEAEHVQIAQTLERAKQHRYLHMQVRAGTFSRKRKELQCRCVEWGSNAVSCMQGHVDLIALTRRQ